MVHGEGGGTAEKPTLPPPPILLALVEKWGSQQHLADDEAVVLNFLASSKEGPWGAQMPYGESWRCVVRSLRRQDLLYRRQES